MLSVELGYLSDILDAAGQAKNISHQAKIWSRRIYDAIWEHAVKYLIHMNLSACL